MLPIHWLVAIGTDALHSGGRRQTNENLGGDTVVSCERWVVAHSSFAQQRATTPQNVPRDVAPEPGEYRGNRPTIHNPSRQKLASRTPDSQKQARLGRTISHKKQSIERSVQAGVAWWESGVQAQLLGGRNEIPVNLETLLLSALRNSAQIQVFSDLPLIRETAITEADARFDWTSFMDSRWDDNSDPVGNELTTGGAPRFRDHNLSYRAGVRRMNVLGGQFEAAQRLGHQNNNSTFFLPNDQGTARLTLSYTQPLLRGHGRVYNTSMTVLAQLDTKIAEDEFERQLQSHLLEVTRAFWGLYQERAVYLQRTRSLARAQELMNGLHGRQEVDTVRSQLVQAEAAVAARQSDILRAKMAIQNAESRLRSLINDPALGQVNLSELIPMQHPMDSFVPVDMDESLQLALQNRPEIGQATKQVKSACVRLNMSKNELLPVLNAVVETYVAGLEGESQVGRAFENQFSEGEPGYGIGLQYEMPIWNRAATARYQRRRLEVRQLQNQFRTTVETLKLEVEVAVREVLTSHRELEAKRRAMQASEAEVEYIRRRWEVLPGDDRSASLLIENLLQAQERLLNAENEYLSSLLTYNLAQMNHKRAIGVLLDFEQVSLCRSCDCCLPRYSLDKPLIESASAVRMSESPGAVRPDGKSDTRMALRLGTKLQK